MILRIFDQPSNGQNAEEASRSATIRVIGDRFSGKTTYMAALARWPNANANSPVQSIIPITEEGEELIQKAQNILEQGLEMEPTGLNSADDLKDYSLSIVLKEQFSWRGLKSGVKPELVTLNISCKDYAGEFFSDLLYKAGNFQLEEYLEDCVEADGLMLLFDGNARKRDSEYANGVDKLLMSLDRSDISGVKRRIAMVLSKCEVPDLWTSQHRYQPQKLAEARFPQTYRKLKAWQDVGSGRVDFFNCSAFGVLGSQYPEPNSKKIDRNEYGMHSVIKDPKRWRPFGLVAPIYWLCTGQRHKDLEKD